MERRDFLKGALGTVITTAMVASCQNVEQKPGSGRKPNVLIVLTDDQGYSDVGFHSHPCLKTPNMDSFAANAVEFEQFYVMPLCAPTRASLLTGRDYYRTGVQSTAQGNALMDPAEKTMAEVFKEAGYVTGIIGKWHLGDNYPYRPVDRGFDESIVHVSGLIGSKSNPLDGNSYFSPTLLHNGKEELYQGYCADIWADRAIDIIEQNSDKPFFLHYATNLPHLPFTTVEKYSKPYEEMGLSASTARFYGMIEHVDHNFGLLLKKLEDENLIDDTIVIFMGDNGTAQGNNGRDLHEFGLRGRKTYVYENGIRVPFCIRFAKGFKGGIKIDTIASCIDVMPTLLDICGVKKPEDVKFDGVSLVPLLKSDVATATWPERNLYTQSHGGNKPERYRNMAVRSQRFKLVQPVGRGNGAFGKPRFELYEIANDPFEKNDVAGQYPEVVGKLKADYEKWFDGLWKERDFQPLRINVGTKFENPVTISNDNLRDGVLPVEERYYALDIKEAGNYHITCRLSDVYYEEFDATVKLCGLTLEKEILIVETKCRFDNVFLPAGKTDLRAWYETKDGKKENFRFIVFEKV